MQFLKPILILIALFMFNYANADELLEVNDVTISATGINAKKARESALEKGQLDAFILLTKDANFSPSIIAKNKDNILNAAREFQIVKESMTRSSYHGTINVYFSKNHVDKIILNEGIDPEDLPSIRNYTTKKSTIKEKKSENNDDSDDNIDPQTERRLIIPIANVDGKTMLWNEENLWFKAWSNNIAIANEEDIIVPIGDLDDISHSSFNILLAKYDSFRELTARYKTKEIIIAFAEIKRNKTKDGGYKLSLSLNNLSNKHEHNFLKKVTDIQSKDMQVLLNDGIQAVLNSRNNKLFDLKNLEVQIYDNIELDAIYNIEDFSDWTSLSETLSQMSSVVKFKLSDFNDTTLIINIISKSDIPTLKRNFIKKGYSLLEKDGNFIIRKDK
jgi:hypothetical protein